MAKTLEAMRGGADVIVQGALRDGRWFGKPDVLRRIATPSAFGGDKAQRPGTGHR